MSLMVLLNLRERRVVSFGKHRITGILLSFGKNPITGILVIRSERIRSRSVRSRISMMKKYMVTNRKVSKYAESKIIIRLVGSALSGNNGGLRTRRVAVVI